MADINQDHPLQPTRPSVPEHEQPRSMESHPGSIPEPHDHAAAHERSDVNIRAIALFVVGLFAAAVVIQVGLWALMKVYSQQTIESGPRVAPLAAPAGALPPEPRLLTNEPAALQQLRDEENARLKNIEAAKQAVLDQGLPARAEGKPPAASPAEAAALADSSSGRQ